MSVNVRTVRAPSLQDIADATGYSLMTVSRAIRDTGVVSEKARKIISKEADRIGYRYNPEITRMMSMMRSGHRDRYHETLAMLWFTDPERIESSSSLANFKAGAIERGEELGYKLDMFYFDSYERKAKRFCEALHARNVRGVILTPLLGDEARIMEQLKMSWGNFAWVAFGNTQSNQDFNRVGHHHYFGMEALMERLGRLGYRRPALAISSKLDGMVHHAYSGSFLSHHPCGPSEGLKLVVPEKTPYSALGQWLSKTKADVLITQHNQEILRSLREAQIRIPEDLGCASVHTHEETGVSGISQRNQILGSYSVDMLVAQLHRGDLGLPKEPKLMLHKGVWIDGETTRKP